MQSKQNKTLHYYLTIYYLGSFSRFISMILIGGDYVYLCPVSILSLLYYCVINDIKTK